MPNKKTTKKTTTTNKNLPIWHILIIALLGLNLAFNIISAFETKGTEPSSALEVEVLKAGGEENFKLMKEIFESPAYQAQQKTNLQQTLQAFGRNDAETIQAPKVETKENKDELAANKKKFKEMAKTAKFVGNDDARFTIYEYSELHCPYCQRQHNQGTLNATLKELDGEVNTAYKHFIVHPSAQKYAEAAECITDQLGDKGHIEFIHKAFSLKSAINDSSLETIIDEMDVNKEDVMTCLDEGKYTQLVQDESNEGRAFGVSGTPGNLIVDNDTGRYTLVPGAYPADKFIEEIKKLMDK